MLEGSLWDKILIVALPFAFTGIMQQLFNAADIAMLGQFVGKEAMAAVGSNSPIIAMVLSLFIGVSLGANVVIARFIGTKNIHGVHAAVHTAILVALGSGVVMTILGEIAAAPLLRALSVPDEIFDMSVLYLRIFLLGMPVILLYNFESSIFRSQGDTRTPLYCLIVSGVVKFFLNLFFILILDMSVEGVAIGTVVASTISSGLLFYFLCRSTTDIRVHLQDFHVDKRILMPMLRIGLPAGVQGMVFALSNLCIQSAINGLGPDVMAASAAAFNVEIFIFFIVNAFGQVCTTFVSQNYGARKLDRCKQVLKWCLVQDIIIGVACGAFVYAFGIPILSIFNSDAAVIAYGMIRVTYVGCLEVIESLIDVFSGAMRGYGSSLIPALITLFGICGTRIAWVYTVFSWEPDFETLMMVFPISWGVSAVILIAAYQWFVKHLRA